MADMRIPLQVTEDSVVLPAVIECQDLRIRHQLTGFVIDTGSKDAFLSQQDVERLQVPIANRSTIGPVDFGGSTFNQVELPVFTLHLLDENQKAIPVKTRLTALKTTKIAPEKVKRAQILPSILGMRFLKEQGFTLIVNAKEGIARLER